MSLIQVNKQLKKSVGELEKKLLQKHVCEIYNNVQEIFIINILEEGTKYCVSVTTIDKNGEEQVRAASFTFNFK